MLQDISSGSKQIFFLRSETIMQLEVQTNFLELLHYQNQSQNIIHIWKVVGKECSLTFLKWFNYHISRKMRITSYRKC